jgi:hypothetical protein
MGTTGIVATKQLLQGGWAKPEELYIHGLDPLPPGLDVEELDKFSDDAERLQPPEPGLVDSIIAHGVNDAITVVPMRSSAGERATIRVVVNGRQRTMAGRLANQRLAAAKSAQTVSIPYVVRKEADHVSVAVSNEWHKPLSAVAKAREAQRLLKCGHSKADVCAVFRGPDGKTISRGTLENWLSLLKLPAEQQEAIAKGEMPATAGYALADAPPEQRAAVQTNGKSAADVKRALEGAPPKPRAATGKPTQRALAALADQYELSDTGEEYDSEIDAVVGALLGWITTGDLDLLDQWPDVRKRCAKVTRPSNAPLGKEVL